MEFNIKTDNKPALEELLKTNKDAGVKLIKVFAELMEEAARERWYDLPQLFSRDLTLSDLVKGILHGVLNLPAINPDAYPVLKEEVHPLSMLSPRKNYLEGGIRYVDWRNHFRLPGDQQVNQQAIERIFRSMLRYYKFLDFEELAEAIDSNQIVAYRGLGERAIEHLPFIPALRYQKAMFGDLHVGKMYDEVGAFDCGLWTTDDTNDCAACQRPDTHKVGRYHICLACNAGFREEAL